MFDLLFTQVNHKEIEFLLSDVKENFIQNLFDLIREYENREIDNSDNQDIIIMVIKLLGRMGHLPRTMKYNAKVEMKEKHDTEYYCLLMNNSHKDKQLKFNLSEAINSIYGFIKNIIEKKQNIPKSAYIDNSYKFLKNTLIKIFHITENENMNNYDLDFFSKNINRLRAKFELKKKNSNLDKSKSFSSASNLINDINDLKIFEDDPLLDHIGIVHKTIIEKIIYCLINFLLLSNIYSNNCKNEIEETFNVLTKVVMLNFIILKENGKEFTQSNKNYLLLKGIIENMSYRVLVVRGEPSYENLSEPYNFGIKIIENMLDYIGNLQKKFPQNVSQETYNAFVSLILDQIINLTYHKKINKSFAGLMSLERILNLIPKSLIYDFSFKIMSLIFSFLQTLTDIIDIENKNICFTIGDKIMDILQESPQLDHLVHPFLKIFFNNMISIKEINNKAAIRFFQRFSKILNIMPTILLYYTNETTAEKYDLPSKMIRKQINFGILELIEKHNALFVSQILQKCFQVLDGSNINEEELNKYKLLDNNKLKLFSSALKTLEFLMSLDVIPFRIIIDDQNAMVDYGDEKLIFDPDFKQLMEMNAKLIHMNETIFRSASDIIIQNPNIPSQMQGMYSMPNMPNNQEYQPQSLSDERRVEMGSGGLPTGVNVNNQERSSSSINNMPNPNMNPQHFMAAQQAQNRLIMNYELNLLCFLYKA